MDLIDLLMHLFHKGVEVTMLIQAISQPVDLVLGQAVLPDALRLRRQGGACGDSATDFLRDLRHVVAESADVMVGIPVALAEPDLTAPF